MVRTMEANKYFLGKDRVYVGSLLMVVLQVFESVLTEYNKFRRKWDTALKC